jgi:hypothetical protein
MAKGYYSVYASLHALILSILNKMSLQRRIQ